ncbi:MAG: HDIG domain-containing protein [Anaerolineae bacterium]|nr:MAG: HDIG domain-containing protein [Anaerolineae bacterium]
MDERRHNLRRRISRTWEAAQLWIIFALGLVGTVAALSISSLENSSAVALQAGDVAAQDVLAPHELGYESEVLTDQAKAAAEQSVADIFDPPNSAIARLQLERLTAALDFIAAVRADGFASSEERLQDLLSMEDLQLDPQAARAILDLPDSRWEAVRLESLSVLEQVMRGEIHEDRVDDASRGVRTLISFGMAEEQAQQVEELVSAFVVANALFNEEETALARRQARDAVAPVTRSFAPGQTIVARGDPVSSLDMEALEAFDLLEPANRLQDLASLSLLVTVLGSAVALFAYRVNPEMLQNVRVSWVTSALFVIASLGLGYAISGQSVLPYFFPVATLSMLLAILVGPGMGVMSALVLGALAGYLGLRGLEIALYFMLSGALGALAIGRAERLGIFAWAGLVASLAAVAVVVVFRIPDPAADTWEKARVMGGALTTGILSAGLAFGVLLLIGSTLRITTNIQLIELSRPDHPLLQLLLRAAPGTYQHSLQVANLAEQAARAIDANALLTRVGCLFHDVGKTERPQFFIENQLSGQNIHEQMDPATSASMIIAHVTDGMELARKHRLPRIVADFIPEHHGTMRTDYQYHLALKAAGDDPDSVDPRDFTYPGPRPRSKETAILMLADGVEGKVRADMPEDEASLDEAVAWVIEDRLSRKQLARTDLTLKNLDTVRRSFVKTLRTIYHPRIRYPAAAEETVPDESELQDTDSIATAKPKEA